MKYQVYWYVVENFCSTTSSDTVRKNHFIKSCIKHTSRWHAKRLNINSKRSSWDPRPKKNAAHSLRPDRTRNLSVTPFYRDMSPQLINTRHSPCVTKTPGEKPSLGVAAKSFGWQCLRVQLPFNISSCPTRCDIYEVYLAPIGAGLLKFTQR